MKKDRGSLVKLPAKGYLLIWAVGSNMDGGEQKGKMRSPACCFQTAAPWPIFVGEAQKHPTRSIASTELTGR